LRVIPAGHELKHYTPALNWSNVIDWFWEFPGYDEADADPDPDPDDEALAITNWSSVKLAEDYEEDDEDADADEDEEADELGLLTTDTNPSIHR
jgi:hypothetical protein